MTIKEFKDYILKHMTAEEALEKLLSSHLFAYEKLKLSGKEKCHPEIIIAMAAMDLGWQMVIEKSEKSEMVRGITIGTEDYIQSYCGRSTRKD